MQVTSTRCRHRRLLCSVTVANWGLGWCCRLSCPVFFNLVFGLSWDQVKWIECTRRGQVGFYLQMMSKHLWSPKARFESHGVTWQARLRQRQTRSNLEVALWVIIPSLICWYSSRGCRQSSSDLYCGTCRKTNLADWSLHPCCIILCAKINDSDLHAIPAFYVSDYRGQTLIIA